MRSQGPKDQDISNSNSNTSLTLKKVHLVVVLGYLVVDNLLILSELVSTGGHIGGASSCSNHLTAASLIIDGKSVSSLHKSNESWNHFRSLALECETVIACRLSPIQKSQLVRMMKSKMKTVPLVQIIQVGDVLDIA